MDINQNQTMPTMPAPAKKGGKAGKAIMWIIIALIVIVGGYFLIKGNYSGQPASSAPIKIGLIGPLTGDAAAYGEPLTKVVKLTVDEINNGGGIEGRTLEVIYEDGKCNGADSANAMNKLVSVDKVQVVIGGFCSSEALAAEPIATKNKVFLFSASASSPDLTGKSLYFARNYPSDATQGRILADISYNKENFRKVAFIQEQLDYPLGIFQAFSESFEDLGGTTVKEEFSSQITDFRSIIAKLKVQNPDALFIDTQTPATAQRIMKQLSESGWNPKLLISDTIAGDSTLVKENSVLLEGALAAEFGTDPDNPKFQHIVDLYKDTYGTDMPYQNYGQCFYDAVYMLKDGLETVGYNGEELANWIRTVKDWQGASGLVTIESNGDRASGHTPEIVINGEIEKYTK